MVGLVIGPTRHPDATPRLPARPYLSRAGTGGQIACSRERPDRVLPAV